jgi:hypothetical protein
MASTKVNIKITLADGTTHELIARDREVIALEERFNIDTSEFRNRMRTVWLAFLAWQALRNHNLISLDFDAFKVTDFQLEVDFGSEPAPGNV